MSQVIDAVGYGYGTLGHFFDFYVNNTFYLLAPDYYRSFYTIYLNRCLSVYDGWVNGWHNGKQGLVPQRMLQSVARGLNNKLFAHGIDFVGENSYDFATSWAKKTKLYSALKKAHLFSIAGGTSLLKLNRSDKDLFLTAHRIDTFFADTDSNGKIISCRIYYDAIQNTNPNNKNEHYGIFEERYFNEQNKPCVKVCIYKGSANLQSDVSNRPKDISAQQINWQNLPLEVKRYVKTNFPSVVVDKEQYLPFYRHLGLFLMKFTENIGQLPNINLGQPIGDILFTENFQYDQMKYFEKNEVDLAVARALIPEEWWNKDDPNYENNALDQRFYQKVSTTNSDSDKITPIQFALRGMDIKTQKENIYKDIAFKIGVSASTIASFLSEGSGAKTATEIINERTTTDTWIDSQINLNKPDIDDMLGIVMRYYGKEPVSIVFKTENQTPQLDTLKTYGDQLTVGNITPELFVKIVHKNLSQEEQQREIAKLYEMRALKNAQTQAMTEIYKKNT